MILKEEIKVIHKKSGKTYKILGILVNTTNGNNDEVMVLYKHFNTNERADFVRTYAEFVEKFDVNTNDFFDILEELKTIYTSSKITANRPKMPKFETFEELHDYIINNCKEK